MAKAEDNLVDTLKSRGLSCSKLKSLEKNKLGDAKTFRSVGFNSLAQREEQSAKDVRGLRNKVCRLK